MGIFFAVQAIDEAVLGTVQAGISPWMTGAMLAITFLGNPIFWFFVATCLYWRGQENKGFFLVNLIAFVSAAAGTLKMAFMRPRPSSSEFEVLGLDGYSMKSFPSGHATMIAAAFYYAHKMTKRLWKPAFGLVVLLVAYSRLYLGMHFLTDVLAGLVLGAVIGKLNLVARNRLFHRNFKPSKLEDELALVALVAAAVLAVLFLKSIPLAGLFLGFYAGFFLFKEMEMEQSILLNKPLLLKYLAGFAVLGALLLIGEGFVDLKISLDEVQRFALYAFGGFWVSWLWPWLFERVFRAKR
jgi:undecaprenyl-diphosphatase